MWATFVRFYIDDPHFYFRTVHTYIHTFYIYPYDIERTRWLDESPVVVVVDVARFHADDADADARCRSIAHRRDNLDA